MARILATALLGAHSTDALVDPATTMKAGALTQRPWSQQVKPEFLQEVEVNVPSPGQGQVVVQVAGSSVNPVDWKLIESPLALTWSFPHILGRDCAGTVVALGEGVERLQKGDKVWADSSDEGCFGEYVALKESITGLAPLNIELADAAVLPLVGLTGLEALQFAGANGPDALANKTVVVLGGAGGAGHIGIQLAKAFGASTVITTCGTSHVDFCSQMGADHVIDYHVAEWHDVIEERSVDVVYDTVSQDGSGDLAYDILRDGGAYVTLLSTLASKSKADSRPSIRQETFLTDSSDYRQLDIIKGFVEAGKVMPTIRSRYEMFNFSAAILESMGGHATGKISVVPSSQSVVVV